METIKIPFRNYREKIKIMRKELNKGREVRANKSHVLSSAKESRSIKVKEAKTFKNFGCNVCNSTFRITTTGDVQWAICNRCGSPNIDTLKDEEEQIFEQRIS